MNMSQKDALHVLGLTTAATVADIKQAYRKACSIYHPDRNPAGLEMQKLVNAAYAALQDYEPTNEPDNPDHAYYGTEVNTALNAIITCGLDIEICGAWIWVSGDTRPHKDTLKTAGFRWAPKKQMWHFRPAEYKSFGRGNWDMDKIRAKHGSQAIKPRFYKPIERSA